MSDTIGLKLEATDTDVQWSDMVRSLGSDGDGVLAGFGMLNGGDGPFMVECTDCLQGCECGECGGCGC